MEEVLEWFFETKIGYIIFLIFFGAIFFIIGKVIFPNFFNFGFFIGSVPTAIILGVFKKDLTKWY